jgi:mRNA-degrading endonuclease toxin of MazEF toxin-antitoxin module
MSPTELAKPGRGEIWWIQFPTDTPGKKRPGVIVSLDVRNTNLRATTVLAVPLSTSVHKLGPFHLLLPSGETGLREDSVVWADNITTIHREQLVTPVEGHRRLTTTRICTLADLVRRAMGCL